MKLTVLMTTDHSLVPLLLKKLTESGHLEKEDIKYVTHRM